MTDLEQCPLQLITLITKHLSIATDLFSDDIFVEYLNCLNGHCAMCGKHLRRALVEPSADGKQQMCAEAFVHS